MRHPDPLIMSADIARVAAERPEMGDDLVQALYQHLVLIERRQPTIDALRDYVDRVSSLDQEELRQRLGLARRKRARAARIARHPGPSRTMSTAAEAADPPPAARAPARRPGRPGWTSELFCARYAAARDRATPPYTYQSIADQFETLDGSVGADPDHLRKLMKRYGQPPG